MKNLILTAASLLIFAPCAMAQDGPPAPPPQAAPGTPAPAAPGAWHGRDKVAPRAGRPDARGMRDDEHGKMGGRDEMMGPDRGRIMMDPWWKNPEVAARIGLRPEQTKKIEDLFLQSKVELIHLHATLEEQQLMMGPLMDANPVDQAKAGAQIDKIADTRAALEKTNAKMLLSIRAVLSADQWTKLQERPHGPKGRPVPDYMSATGSGAK